MLTTIAHFNFLGVIIQGKVNAQTTVSTPGAKFQVVVHEFVLLTVSEVAPAAQFLITLDGITLAGMLAAELA
jgi:hypothetical protein